MGTLQEVHSGIVDAAQRLGVVDRTTLPVRVGIHASFVAVRTSYPDLTNLDGLALALRGGLNVEGGGGKNLQAVLAQKAVQGSKPVLVLVEGKQGGLRELTEWTLESLNEGQIDRLSARHSLK